MQVVFPHGSFAERDGLLMNIDGLVQGLQANPSIGPGNLLPTLEILEEIHGELSGDHIPRRRADLVRTLVDTAAIDAATWAEGLKPEPAEVTA